MAASLSIEEKVGQLVQLTGDFFNTSEEIIVTGPMKKLGLDSEKYQLGDTGSILNIVNPQEIMAIQEKYLAQSAHKIPLLFMADIIYGYKTIFPIPLAQTCSWNFDLIKASAEVIAKECYEAGIHVTFAPMVDVVRDPRWGRVMESPGEDTLVAQRYSQTMVEGIQGKAPSIPKNKLAACVKHFAAYGAPRAGIEYGAVELSDDSLRNYYLPSYQAAIDAGVKLVMTAFNTLNGVPCTGNQWLNREILRKEFDFSGVLIADYAAVEELKNHGYTANDRESAKRAIESTLDIDMKTSVYANHLADLAKSDGSIMELLDEAALRVLTLKNELGLFEDPYRGLKDDKQPSSILSEEHRKLSQRLAEESTVLLKNDGVLPLKKGQRIGLIGPYSEEPSALGFWAITGDAKDTVTLAEGMKALENELDWEIQTAAGARTIEAVDVEKYGKYSEIITVDERSDQELLQEAAAVAENADILVLALGESVYQSGEAGSRVDPSLPKSQLNLIKQMKQFNKKIVLVVYAGRPLLLTEIADEVDAILYTWYPGTNGGKALANILSGQVNPSGKLSMTFPRAVGQIPLFYNTNSTGRSIDTNNPNHRFASRYIDESNDPLYCFGYGLSYTEFIYQDFQMDKTEIMPEETLTAAIKVRNAGSQAGQEIVQLYLHDIAASTVRPVKELKDFQKIALAAGEEKTVTFTITPAMLHYYTKNNCWESEAGEFELFIGKDASDHRFSAKFTLLAKESLC
ncbi:hypothetical protein RV10_GL001086 [Enterococcus pallens]|nr:hypothetical protein RV10_GL001086 [Enterococcus pallens]